MPYQLQNKTVYFVGEPEVKELTTFQHKTDNVQNFNIQDFEENFIDPEFPHNDDSIGYIEKLFDSTNRSCIARKKKGFTGMVDWFRIQDFIHNMAKCELSFPPPKTFAGAKQIFMVDSTGRGITEVEVNCGAIRDSWFVGALAEVMLDEPGHFSFVVPKDNMDSDFGIYHFRYWFQGLWLDIFVDDYLPFIRYNHEGEKYWVPLGGELVVNESGFVETWVALAEKAYAKLLHSFKSINDHKIRDVLESLTGGIVEHYKLDEMSPENLFDKLEFLLNQTTKKLSVATTSNNSGTQFGLRFPHAYSILSITTVHSYGDEVRLLKLRNPHGRMDKEWTGKWSDQEDFGFGPSLASEWVGVSQEEQRKIGLVAEDDGEFFIEIEDFIRYFTSIEICHLVPRPDDDSPPCYKLCSELHADWNEQNKYCGKPLVIEVENTNSDLPCTLIINIIYKQKNEESKFPCIGVTIHTVPEKFRNEPLGDGFTTESQEIDPSKGGKLFSTLSSNTFTVEVDSGIYAVVPKILDPKPNSKGEFLLRLIHPVVKK